MINKVVASAAEAVADIHDGASLAVGGFGLCGIPVALIEALHQSGATNLETVSNNCGVDDWGLGILLKDGRIRRTISSYVGENKEFARQYLAGELEVVLTPQGTLAEKLRAGGAGIPAFYTPAGVGTQVSDGGLPQKYDADGNIAIASAAKEVRSFHGADYVLEESLTPDFGLVHAWKGDRHGNLVFHATAMNFNPLCAMAGKITIAEVEELVEPGELDPEHVHIPGIFVQRVVLAPDVEKRIEKRTVALSAASASGSAPAATCTQPTQQTSQEPRPWNPTACQGAPPRPEAVRHEYRPRRRRAPRRCGEQGLDAQRTGRAGGAGAAQRAVRQPRHRHAHADSQLHPRRRRGGAALRERDPRRRAVPGRGRGGSGPDQCRQGNRHGQQGRRVLRLRRLLRHDPRRARGCRRARRDGSGRGTATWPTG